MKRLAFILLLGSCEGRCKEREAVRDVVPAGAQCWIDTLSDTAFCKSRDQEITCQIEGTFFHVAHCEVPAAAEKL